MLIVGQARFQTALLAEARVLFHNDSKEIFIDDLWLTVQKFNAQCDNHARISKDLILVASPDKPFLRAGKGTVTAEDDRKFYMRRKSTSFTTTLKERLPTVSWDQHTMDLQIPITN